MSSLTSSVFSQNSILPKILFETGSYFKVSDQYHTIRKKYKRKKKEVKLYNYHAKKYETCEWYGESKSGYAHGIGIGYFLSNDAIYVGSVHEGSLSGFGRVFTYDRSVKRDISSMVDGNFENNSLKGVGIVRLPILNSFDYLIVVADFDGYEIDGKGVGFLSNSNTLENFGKRGYICKNGGSGKGFKCNFDESSPLAELKRDRGIGAALGVVAAAALFAGGAKALKESLTYDGNSYSSPSSSSSSDCFEIVAEHKGRVCSILVDETVVKCRDKRYTLYYWNDDLESNCTGLLSSSEGSGYYVKNNFDHDKYLKTTLSKSISKLCSCN